MKTENTYKSKSLHMFVALLKIYRSGIWGYDSVCKKYLVCKFPDCIQSFKWVVDIRNPSVSRGRKGVENRRIPRNFPIKYPGRHSINRGDAGLNKFESEEIHLKLSSELHKCAMAKTCLNHTHTITHTHIHTHG